MKPFQMHPDETGSIGKSLVLLVALFLAGGAALAYFLLGDDADKKPVTGSSGSPTPQMTPLAEEKWGAEYIRIDRETGSGDSAKHILQVYFVNDKLEGFVLAQRANRCVRFNLKEFDAVSCYAFSSVEALEFAGVDEESGGMEKLCWRAFASKSNDGASTIRVEQGQYQDEGCPV